MTTAIEARQAYATALQEYREAQRQLQHLADRLHGLGDALAEAPLTLAPKHPDAGERIPLHVLTSPVRHERDLEDWPDANAILEALSTLHATHARAYTLYSWLLPEDRAQEEAP